MKDRLRTLGRRGLIVVVVLLLLAVGAFFLYQRWEIAQHLCQDFEGWRWWTCISDRMNGGR